eukprot:210118-Prymnesium_polylepis.1
MGDDHCPRLERVIAPRIGPAAFARSFVSVGGVSVPAETVVCLWTTRPRAQPTAGAPARMRTRPSRMCMRYREASGGLRVGAPSSCSAISRRGS